MKRIKKDLVGKILPVAIALALASPGGARADFNPVPLTPGSYTFKIVVPKDAPAPLPYNITATAGAGTSLGDTTYFEQGFYNRPGTVGGNQGIPAHNSVFTNINDATVKFLMPPDYTTNNTVLVDATTGSGTFTFVTPTTATDLAILNTSGGGASDVNYLVTHADSSTETGSLSMLDWFNGGPTVAWGANGRVDVNGNYGNQNNSSVNNNPPYLYCNHITVSGTSPVVSIAFTFADGQHPNFYAVSGNGSGSGWTPIPVTGFNEVSIVAAFFALTATMDQGTNTAYNGNLATWFEQGYIPGSPSYGLPPSGSTFGSQSQPTHFYTMGDYSTNHAILIDANHLSNNIVPASPAAYTSFAFLTGGGNIGGGNKMTNYCIFQHGDGVNETNVFIGYDWFEGGVPNSVALVANGRVNMANRTANNLGNGNPKLFETYFTLADNGSPVTNIILLHGTSPGGNSTTFVMAVSATAGAVAPTIQDEPQWANAHPGDTAHFNVNLTTGTSPVYTWQKASSPAGPFTSVTDSGRISGSATAHLTLANVSAADEAWYQVVVSNSAGSITSAPPVELYLLTSTLTNITLPGDVISDATFANSLPPAPNEGVTNVVDGTTAKYLCYGANPSPGSPPFEGPVGFVITPSVGSTVISAIRIFTADTTPESDPADCMIDGSNDGGATWTPILADTPLSLPDNRNSLGQIINLANQPLEEIDFANSAGYSSYRVTFENVKTNDIAFEMQVAEVQLLGIASGPPVVIAPYSLAENSVVVAGGTAVLKVNETGTSPLTNQWTFNGVPLTDNGRITGSHSNILTIANAQPGDAGYYQLNLTNGAGFYSVYPGGGADQNLAVISVPTFLTNGPGWTANSIPATSTPVIANNILTLTDGTGGTQRSFFFDSPLYIGAFEASFTYQTTGGADGFTFTLQNDPRGASAIGSAAGGGGGLGVAGITPSAEFTFNIYTGSAGGVGMSFGTNGANGNPYHPTGTLNIASGDPINVTITYGNGVAGVSLVDSVTNASFSTNIVVGNLETALGGDTAYIGFTGADGGVSSTQTITDFVYVPLTSLSVQVSGANVELSWPLLPAAYTLQSESGLTGSSWQSVTAPVDQSSGKNVVTLPIGSGGRFYRLAIPVPAQ